MAAASPSDGPRGHIALRCVLCGHIALRCVLCPGEPLPERFFQLAESDLRECDLLIILGTSLKVHPFASLVGLVADDVPRLLINREQVGADALT